MKSNGEFTAYASAFSAHKGMMSKSFVPSAQKHTAASIK